MTTPNNPNPEPQNASAHTTAPTNTLATLPTRSQPTRSLTRLPVMVRRLVVRWTG